MEPYQIYEIKILLHCCDKVQLHMPSIAGLTFISTLTREKKGMKVEGSNCGLFSFMILKLHFERLYQRK